MKTQTYLKHKIYAVEEVCPLLLNVVVLIFILKNLYQTMTTKMNQDTIC